MVVAVRIVVVVSRVGVDGVARQPGSPTWLANPPYLSNQKARYSNIVPPRHIGLQLCGCASKTVDHHRHRRAVGARATRVQVSVKHLR